MRRHLTALPASTRRRIDLRRVVVVGHSRGGEGAANAAATTPSSGPVRVVGFVAVGATNFGMAGVPHVPMVAVLPYCDGDVAALEGQRTIERGRDLVPGDSAFRSAGGDGRRQPQLLQHRVDPR